MVRTLIAIGKGLGYLALTLLMLILYLMSFFPLIDEDDTRYPIWELGAENLGVFMGASAILVFLIYRFLCRNDNKV